MPRWFLTFLIAIVVICSLNLLFASIKWPAILQVIPRFSVYSPFFNFIKFVFSLENKAILLLFKKMLATKYKVLI